MGNSRPATALASANVDLAAVLGSTSAFVGFTSGTGSAYGDHDVLSWEFRDDFEPIDRVPDPGSTFLLFSLSAVGLAGFRKKLASQKN